MPAGQSWHIPRINKYRTPGPAAILNVVYLQRMTDIEQQQVKSALEAIDHEAAQELNIPQIPSPRELRFKSWIRDYSPTSASTLEIAKDAYDRRYDHQKSYSSLVLVDSGWELGNVIVAHWHREGEDDDDANLLAARVPMAVANVLLTACDEIEGMTLPHALGSNAFQQSQVDFYRDLPPAEQTKPPEQPDNPWPSHLPEDLTLVKSHPVLVSLRRLDDRTISKLKQEIDSGSNGKGKAIQLYNWEGKEPTDRLALRDLFNQIHRNTREADQDMRAFFVDYMLQGPREKPQIVSVGRIRRDPGPGVEVLPIYTPKLFSAWEKAAQGQDLEDELELVDIWKKEHVNHLNNENTENFTSACPVFFLHPFTQEEERQVRTAITALGDVEEGEDWGHLFMWHGYPFQDGKEHTLEDLRDLFEASDPLSPFYDKQKAGPYRLNLYPRNFVAVDEKVFDTGEPVIWMASTLDFSGKDTSDKLGWTIGRLDAAQASITFVNLDIANVGPEECFDEDTVDKLWLSDLNAYREEEWAVGLEH